jgi:SsrA-binding protein
MKLISQNKKVAHEYFILDSFECGIVLRGTEIKSIRLGKVSINDSFCRIKNNELFIINMNISKYIYGNLFNHDEIRERKLLMEKREIIKLSLKLKQEGMTLIPTKVYLNEALCKVEVALCKGKKLYDKRQSAKEDDQKQHIQKSIKEFGKIH